MKSIVAIVQARMGSTRLPGKVLLPILGRPMLSYIIARLRSVQRITNVVVATSEKSRDDPIVSFCAGQQISCHRGSEEDVLDRFYKAALAEKADHVIRITADCPLVDPQVVHELMELYFDGGYDHCGVATGAGATKAETSGRYPDGLDAEIFSLAVLQRAWKESTTTLHREHVTPFIWQQPDRFKLGQLKSATDYSHLRFTVDNKEDYELIRWMYESLYPTNPMFGLRDAVSLLQQHPERLELNKQYIGKEGYEEFWK